jgi:hypothetical protein
MLNVIDNLSNSNNEVENDNNDIENQDANNYKGIYYGDDNEQQYYEGGAHFKYTVLCKKLENLLLILSPERKGKSIYDDISREVSSVAKTKADSGKIHVENSKVFLIFKLRKI